MDSSLGQLLNDVSVFVCHGDLTYSAFVLICHFIRIFKSKVFKFLQSRFNLVLNEQLELSTLGQQTLFVLIMILPVKVGLLVNVKLNSVVSSCDSFDIPIHVLGRFLGLDVVEVNQGEEVDENTDASDQQPKDSSW